ncbi:Na+/H+ antiporter subunit E [Salinimonas sp. HHU 13199]|uniref:Na+/H+ antiporter subunit E n=1 Tax=Salinimonas profundi TaxID=2729140 RepID=A0ABR8LP59_9ALTE|nr:Na+/H+ antiporter subunit E [Salinimonas profundi]MBD3587393.1 Na+/H+ antiporter subunit E [Salinimonas profundi]
MKSTLRLAVILCVLWVLLSGHFTPLLLFLGVASVALVLWMDWRMDEIDHEQFYLPVTRDLFTHVVKLSWLVILSNIDVCLRIYGIRKASPTFMEIPLPFENPLSKVIFANAITLTPGTVSMVINDNTLLIHSVSKEGAEDLKNGAMVNIIPRIKDQYVKTVPVPASTPSYPPKKIKEKDVSL